MQRLLTALAILCLIAGFASLHAARGQSPTSAEWTTDSFDPQRDSWQRHETKLTKNSIKNLHLLWKLKTDNKAMGMQSFREPLILSDVNTATGIKDLAILAGSSDDLYAVDANSGALFWKHHLVWTSSSPEQPGEGRDFLCTNALTATPVASPGREPGRVIYAMSREGFLHTLDVSSGAEKEPAIQVLPKIYGKPYGLNLMNNRVYTATGQGCSGVPNGVYGVDLQTRMAFASMPAQRGGLWGVAGPAIGADGTVYAATGDGPYDPSAGQLSTSVLAFTPAELQLKDYYTPTNHEWLTIRDLDMNTTPVVFPYKGRDVLVVSGKEGRYYLLDSQSLGGDDHQTPLYRTALISNAQANFQTEGTWGNFASWQDAEGVRWILAPIGGPPAVNFSIDYGPTPRGGVIALSLDELSGKPKLTPRWLSRGMNNAETPVIANGMVFVLDSGEFTTQVNDAEGGFFNSKERIERSLPATLYVLDAKTGKELYSSGDQVASFLHQSGIAVAGGRVVFGTFDGTIYCFGVQ